VNLISKKRCGKIKGRTCADGRPERNYLPKEESASLTISLEALFTTLAIDAHENRAVQTFDMPGAFLQSPLPENKTVFMKFKGKFADIMCNVNPEYKDTIFEENGKRTLYVKVLKATYGLIEAALIWYNVYTDVLMKMGFVLNPYDKCMANKIINSKQCSIGWYVDDNKVSHAEEAVCTSIADAIEKKSWRTNKNNQVTKSGALGAGASANALDASAPMVM
jgi:hypothetical protein